MIECGCCHLEKREEDYHRIEWGIVGEEAVQSLLIEELCKDCLRVEDVRLISPGHYRIENRENYTEAIRSNYVKNVLAADISQFYTLQEIYNLFRDNSLTKSSSQKEFKRTLKKLDKKKFINLILIPRTIDKSVNGYYCKKDEIDEFLKKEIKYKKNGKLILLNKKYINQECIERLDELRDSGFLLNENEKLYIFIDYVSEKCPCKDCYKIKDFSEFRKVSKEGVSLYRCIECERKKQNNYYHNLSADEKAKHIERTKQWIKNNPEKRRIYEKKIRKQPKHRISRNIRKRLKDFLKTKDNNFNKDIGCTRAELVAHIESQFQPGMTWENYGSGTKGDHSDSWHIDHIIPLSKFQGKSPNHYTNLQPLWGLENIIKSNKISVYT